MFVCAFIFSTAWYTGERDHASDAHVVSGGVLLTLLCFIIGLLFYVMHGVVKCIAEVKPSFGRKSGDGRVFETSKYILLIASDKLQCLVSENQMTQFIGKQISDPVK